MTTRDGNHMVSTDDELVSVELTRGQWASMYEMLGSYGVDESFMAAIGAVRDAGGVIEPDDIDCPIIDSDGVVYIHDECLGGFIAIGAPPGSIFSVGDGRDFYDIERPRVATAEEVLGALNMKGAGEDVK